MGATLSRVFFIFTFAMLISLYNSSFISAEEAQKTNELKEVVAEEQQESESAEKGSSEDKSQGTESVEEQQEESVEKEVSEGDKENASQGETSEKEKQEPVEEETEEIKKDKTSEDKIEEATITVQEDISWVIPLKENLTRLGFGGMNINDTYGSFTAQRVGEFQTYYGLKVNKEADEATLAKIDDISSSPFQEGETHDDTIELKRLLTWLGYGNMNINEIYGSFTETRVGQFQRDHGLKDHGMADEPTWDKLYEMVDTVFQVGNEHPGVVELKQNLTTLGFGNMNINEVYGNFTETRVRQFQSAYGLKVDGQVGQETLEKIDELLRVSFYQGKTDSNVISLKEGITKLGFGGMNINEIYGNWTETRVRQFQNYYGLRATGVADPQTVKLANQIASSPFQEGETHEDTIELKKLLTWLGYGNMNINQIYGSFTETRVGQFQRDHGLKDHGIADGPTWDKLYEMVDTVFRVGNEHPGVVELKRNLTTLGFGNMNINEVYGNFTKTRVRQFQSNYGLSVTGQVGQETLAKIDDLLKKSLYKGKNDSDVISLKKDLTKLGFGNMNINEIYGGFTTTRMSQFQAYYGLRATGVADPQTVELLNKIVDTSYQYGKSHGSVKSLKEKLKRLGFGGMNINKVYGSYTAKRVSDFQNYYDLKVNGIVDPVTESLINEIYNSPYQSGKSHRDMKRFKEMLNSIGYGYINVNETFGSFSERQIKKFQSDHHLPNSGILDERTIDLLTYEYDNRVTKIFIDPGHGGYQPGASGYGLQEKDLVLDIALSAATQLEKNYKDIEVKLSRSKDVDRALEERTNMANDWKADYFVSFHNNSHNGQASGFESFIYNGKVSSAAMRHQQNIHQYLVNMLDVNNRGAKRADFSVLRKSIMPAILLEFLFIDNKEDNKLLRKKSYREWLGVITAEAIADSFNLKRK